MSSLLRDLNDLNDPDGVIDLVVIGAGGLGRETAETVRAVNAVRPRFRLLGLLDDAEHLVGTRVGGLPVLGPCALAATLDADVVVAVANPADPLRRLRLVDRLVADGLPLSRFASVVHPAASLPTSFAPPPGLVALAGVVVTCDVHIGYHVALMPHVVLTHDDDVGTGATFGAGARLAGGVSVEAGAYVGAGALVREGGRVGAGAVVGMGAVVLDDVPPGEIWAGVPARRLSGPKLPTGLAPGSRPIPVRGLILDRGPS